MTRLDYCMRLSRCVEVRSGEFPVRMGYMSTREAWCAQVVQETSEEEKAFAAMIAEPQHCQNSQYHQTNILKCSESTLNCRSLGFPGLLINRIFCRRLV